MKFDIVVCTASSILGVEEGGKRLTGGLFTFLFGWSLVGHTWGWRGLLTRLGCGVNSGTSGGHVNFEHESCTS